MLNQAIYIASSPYSGSTLLDILLGQQTSVQSLGEVHRLGMSPLQRMYSFGNRCSCGARLHECAHWEDLRERMLLSVGFPPATDWPVWGVTLETAHRPTLKAKWASWCLATFPFIPQCVCEVVWESSLFREYHDMGRNSWNFMVHLAEASGRRNLVDSTKTAMRLYALWQHNPSQLRVVQLVRDGRGIAYSHMRRTGRGVRDGVKFWKKHTVPINQTLKLIDEERKYMVQYEELCTSPNMVLKRLCNFLEISFDSNLVTLPTAQPHVIPGNPMSSRGDTTIRLDEQWKVALTDSDLSYFSKHGRKLNYSFGYS